MIIRPSIGMFIKKLVVLKSHNHKPRERQGEWRWWWSSGIRKRGRGITWWCKKVLGSGFFISFLNDHHLEEHLSGSWWGCRWTWNSITSTWEDDEWRDPFHLIPSFRLFSLPLFHHLTWHHWITGCSDDDLFSRCILSLFTFHWLLLNQDQDTRGNIRCLKMKMISVILMWCWGSGAARIRSGEIHLKTFKSRGWGWKSCLIQPHPYPLSPFMKNEHPFLSIFLLVTNPSPETILQFLVTEKLLIGLKETWWSSSFGTKCEMMSVEQLVSPHVPLSLQQIILIKTKVVRITIRKKRYQEEDEDDKIMILI